MVRFQVYFPRTASGPWDVRDRRQAGLQDLYIWQGGGALDRDRQGIGATGLEGSQGLFLVPGHLLPHSKPVLSSHIFLFGKHGLPMADLKWDWVASAGERLAAGLPSYPPFVHVQN